MNTAGKIGTDQVRIENTVSTGGLKPHKKDFFNSSCNQLTPAD